MGWNGMESDPAGMGWDGMGWNRIQLDGMGWDGMGWDGMGWDGMGWDGSMQWSHVGSVAVVPRGIRAVPRGTPGFRQHARAVRKKPQCDAILVDVLFESFV